MWRRCVFYKRVIGREKDRLRRRGSAGGKKDTKKKYLDGFAKRHEGDCTKGRINKTPPRDGQYLAVFLMIFWLLLLRYRLIWFKVIYSLFYVLVVSFSFFLVFHA